MKCIIKNRSVNGWYYIYLKYKPKKCGGYDFKRQSMHIFLNLSD